MNQWVTIWLEPEGSKWLRFSVNVCACVLGGALSGQQQPSVKVSSRSMSHVVVSAGCRRPNVAYCRFKICHLIVAAVSLLVKQKLPAQVKLNGLSSCLVPAFLSRGSQTEWRYHRRHNTSPVGRLCCVPTCSDRDSSVCLQQQCEATLTLLACRSFLGIVFSMSVTEF